MSAAFDQLIAQMESKFNRLRTTLLAAVQKKPATALASANASLIGTVTATTLVKAATDTTTAHIAQVNAHGTTAADVGSIEREAVVDALVRRIPEGVLPFYRYGDFTTAALPISSAAFVLKFTGVIPVAMAGYVRTAPIIDIDLATISSPASNKTFFVYLKWNGTVATYLVSATELVETSSRMFLGTVVTGASAITAVNISKVSRLDNYRISVTPKGSAIPAVGNNPTSANTLPSGWVS